MPDPADIIAATILRPPDADMDGSWWQHKTTMSMPGGPAVARYLAEAAVQALADAGWRIVPGQSPDAGTLPAPAQIRNWLALHEWKQGTEEGPAGALWYPPVRGRGVGIPHDGDDPDLITGAIERIAGRMSMSAEQVLNEMMLYG